MSVFVGYFYLV